MHSQNSGGPWPDNVGIIAMDLYFPYQYVDQAELEVYDEVSAGRYTVGRGQTRMAFCSDREDVHSLCLTAVQGLLEKSGTRPEDVGRLEVGTETIVDKSKSVKSVLMQLFEGNTDLEGVDNTNACYGGTAALFNCVNWVESSAWDGRLALAVCADIAVYAAGSARPSGGAGAVAMLIGPNAPLVLDRGLRASHMQHVYDFYKPDMSSEYPAVDAQLSIQCYLAALDRCYAKYKAKASAAASKGVGGPPVSLDTFDAVLFHTPYCKLVQKSVARLALNDFLDTPAGPERVARYPGMDKYNGVELASTYFDRDVEKAFMAASADVFAAKTKPSLAVATHVGNMYTPSLYGGLVSHLISRPADQLAGQKIGLFSYGSGLASSFFSVRVQAGPALDKLVGYLSDVTARLEAREKVPPAEFVSILGLREKAIHAAPHTPAGDAGALFPGTWHLMGIDKEHRRQYARSPVHNNGVVTNGNGVNGHC